jgi:hypothetical protein
MTDFQTSTLAREVLDSGTATLSTSALTREVLLSQVTQLWLSTLVREVLLFGNPVTVAQYAVTVNTS